MPDTKRGNRRRLRTRLMASFAIGGLMLALGVAGLTYVLVRRNLLDQRETSATRQALANGRLVATTLRTPSSIDIPRLLGSLPTPTSSGALVFRRGSWFSSSLKVEPDSLPAALRSRVAEDRKPARQLFRFDGPKLAVGIPLPEGTSYFEVFSLRELQRDLSILRFSLVGASAVTLLASLALGAWASRKLLGPVAEVGRTARSIAGGTLEARLDVSDYEELSDLAESFNRMVDSLQERVERDARFASNVSHELRSPLTTLKSAIQALASRRERMDAQTLRLLDLLSEEVHRFDELVQDLLEISRLDAQSVPTPLEKVFLGELVLHALESTAPSVSAVEITPEARTALVRADKRRLERVINNLVRNAETHGGGVDRIRVGVNGSRARIEVEDRGPGVPLDERDRIFERFYRGVGSGRRRSGDGVGLGLALVAEHMRLHEGRVWVEDVPAGGARFVAELPVVSR